MVTFSPDQSIKFWQVHMELPQILKSNALQPSTSLRWLHLGVDHTPNVPNHVFYKFLFLGHKQLQPYYKPQVLASFRQRVLLLNSIIYHRQYLFLPPHTIIANLPILFRNRQCLLKGNKHRESRLPPPTPYTLRHISSSAQRRNKQTQKT